MVSPRSPQPSWDGPLAHARRVVAGLAPRRAQVDAVGPVGPGVAGLHEGRVVGGGGRRRPRRRDVAGRVDGGDVVGVRGARREPGVHEARRRRERDRRAVASHEVAGDAGVVGGRRSSVSGAAENVTRARRDDRRGRRRRLDGAVRPRARGRRRRRRCRSLGLVELDRDRCCRRRCRSEPGTWYSNQVLSAAPEVNDDAGGARGERARPAGCRGRPRRRSRTRRRRRRASAGR